MIEVARHLVKQQHRGIVQQGAGDGDPLALTAREPRAGLAHVGGVAVAEIDDVVVNAGAPGRGNDLFVARVRSRDGDVVADAAGEQHALLGDVTNPAGQLTTGELADVGTVEQPGRDLQRIQIVKGWVDEGGPLHQRVVAVAGGDNGASVDPLTCEPQGEGARSLCGVWRDPDFDASRPAVYYARVLENPSCRHSAWACLQMAPAERPPGCLHRAMERFVSERAWTSPIWYTPERAELD